MAGIFNISGINKSFGGLKALTDVNLDVEEGVTRAIIGPNGAGKSTLLNICIGKLKPDTGEVRFLDHKLTGKLPHEITQIGISRVFQTPEIFPDLSLLQNTMISIFSKRDGAFKFSLKALSDEKSVKEDAFACLEDLGLADAAHQMAANLSRGDKRRLEMAMCLVQKPRLLLLDEPTAGMSRHDTNQTIELLKKIKGRGITKIIIEHDMHVVFSLADRISVLAQGAIIAEGLPEEIRNNSKVREAYLGTSHE